MRRIRHIQKSVQQTDEDTKQPVKALWKLSQFDSVPSRIKEQLQVVHLNNHCVLHRLVRMYFLATYFSFSHAGAADSLDTVNHGVSNAHRCRGHTVHFWNSLFPARDYLPVDHVHRNYLA